MSSYPADTNDTIGAHNVSSIQIVKCFRLWAMMWQEELQVLLTMTTNVFVFRIVISCSLVQT